MKIIITNNDLHSIQVSIETPYELRALYVLLQLISNPALKLVRNANSSFDHIPGLGKYCKQDIRENPIKRLYQLMTGKEATKPTATQLAAIILECKRAIVIYNQKMVDLFDSNLMQLESADKLPHALLSKATSMRRPLTEREFSHDNWFKLFHKGSNSNKLWVEYCKYAELLASFATIDTSYASNDTGLLDDFRRLSAQIRDDEYMANNDVFVDGIATNWKKHISPGLVGSLAGLGVGTCIAVLKTYYDIALRDSIEGGSLVVKVMVDNSESILAALTVLYVNNKMSRVKENRDNSLKDNAVKTLAEQFPEYRRLLIEKGFPYKGNEITYVNQQHANDDVVVNIGGDDLESQEREVRSPLLGAK